MARMHITRNCKFCGGPFVPWTGGSGFYCTRDCYHASTKMGVAERFWLYVQKNDGCWLWTGGTDPDGYGKMGNARAHRVSWEIHNGPIPEGKKVLHHCDNPPCVRPDHLFLGTGADNNADMVAKDRSPWGARHPNAKLTDELVLHARNLHDEHGMSCQSIVDELKRMVPGLKIGRTGIHAAVTGKTWPHLSDSRTSV